MDLESVELVNVEARRNRQLAIQDSLQARLWPGAHSTAQPRCTSCALSARGASPTMSRACTGLFALICQSPDVRVFGMLDC